MKKILLIILFVCFFPISNNAYWIKIWFKNGGYVGCDANQRHLNEGDETTFDNRYSEGHYFVKDFSCVPKSCERAERDYKELRDEILATGNQCHL